MKIKVNIIKENKKLIKEEVFWKNMLIKVSGLLGTNPRNTEDTAFAVHKFKQELERIYPPFKQGLEGSKTGLKDVILKIVTAAKDLGGDRALYSLQKASPEEKKQFKLKIMNQMIKNHKETSVEQTETKPQQDLPTNDIDPYGETGFTGDSKTGAINPGKLGRAKPRNI